MSGNSSGSTGQRLTRRRAALAFAAVALALVGLGSVFADGSSTRRAKRSSPASERVQSHSADRDAQPPGALPPAIEFAGSFGAYLYGRLPASRVAPASDRVRQELLRGRALVSPAALTRPVVVRDLHVAVHRAESHATALIDDATAPPTLLSFEMTLTRGRWMVTAVARPGGVL